MKRRNKKRNSLLSSSTPRGLVAGIIGGLAGTLVKSLAENFLSVRRVESRSAQIKIVDELSTQILGSPLSTSNEALAEQLVNFPVGASVGAAYGFGKKDKEGMNISDGIILGASTWFSTHETSFPMMGLEKNPANVPLQTQANELIAHVLFGVTTEIVRSKVNDRLRR